MPRPLWSGSLSFGLINVPVALLSAVRDQDLHFHQLHAETHVRLRVERVCRQEDRPVPYEEIAHGFETDSGGYVMLSDDELAAAQPERTRTIDIAQFVAVGEIDPVLFDHPYYLVPNAEADGALRAYALLAEVMADGDRAAIGRFVLRTKEYLVAIRSRGGALALTTMLFHDEVRDTAGLPLPEKASKPKKAQVDQAVELIEAMGEDFDPDRYRDCYRERLEALVERKRKGKTIKAPPAPEEAEAPPDLMAALKASLDAARA